MPPPLDPLDELLDRSGPGTTATTPRLADELIRLRVASRPAQRQRRWLSPVVASFAAALLVGCAAATAAATGTWTLPWAESNPIAIVTYTLPSGIECEERIGGVSGTVPAAIEATENFYRTTDIQALLTDDAIQAAIDQQRGGEIIHVNDDGSHVPGGYGTEYYDADEEYMTAVINVIFTAMDAEIERQGLTGVDNDLTLQAEPNCPGRDR